MFVVHSDPFFLYLLCSMIEDAEKRGSISPGDTLIEATSGNLGIGLAAIAIQKGYKFIAVIPNSYPPDKQKLIKYLGAEVRITGKC